MDPTLLSTPPNEMATWAFAGTMYLLGLGCLYGAWRMGRRQGALAVAREMGIFVFFVAFFFLLESYALYATPFYYYTLDFPQMFQAIDFSFMQKEVGCRPENATLEVPLAVPVMEASLTYAVMWTGHLLRVRGWLLPIMGGFVFVVIDNFLDPVVAYSTVCGSNEPANYGLGLWHWFLTPDSAAYWFGIPVFNMAAWYAAPVMLISIAHMCGSRLAATERLAKVDTIYLLLIALALAVVVFFAPGITKLPNYMEHILFGLVMVASLAIVIKHVSGMIGSAEFQLQFFVVPIAIVAYAVITFITIDLLRAEPLLLPVGIVALFIGWFFAWAPYSSRQERISDFIRDVDRFIRLHYVGFPALLVLIGGVSTQMTATTSQALLLLVVALLYNIFSYVSNDIIDLPVDRTQPKRQLDPLVRGAISTRQAWVVALATIPLALLITARSEAWLEATVYLAVAFSGMTIYNLYGKKISVPLVTDFIEGIAWGSMALYGATYVLGTPTTTTWLIFGYGVLFIFLINGIHGGLRDLVNDSAQQKNTSAILLGATHSENGEINSSKAIIVFSFLVFGCMVLNAIASIVLNLDKYSPLELTVSCTLLLIIELWSARQLWKVVSISNRNRDPAISMSLLALLVPPIVVFAPQMDHGLGWLLAAAFFWPFLALDPNLEKLKLLVFQRKVPKLDYPDESLSG